MYRYLLVILEKGAVPFCHYSNPFYYSSAEPEFMPLEILGKIVEYARENGLFLNFLFGRHPLSLEYESLIGTIGHVKMIPVVLKDIYPDGVPVLEADESMRFSELEADSERNLILSVTPTDLPHLSDMVASLWGKFKRLNLHLVGVETISSAQLDVYQSELKKIADRLAQLYRTGREIEINVISDRLLLNQMNNCDAGIKHLTIAPDGNAYICPAFYYDDEADTVGYWSDIIETTHANHQLLDLGCAPICSRCDAFHCKRCVYLNKKTTLEVNVPSREQCLASHVEREVSRLLLQSLRTVRPFDQFPAIASLTYDDPFDLIVGETWKREEPAAVSATSQDADNCLQQIYEMQKKILRKLELD